MSDDDGVFDGDDDGTFDGTGADFGDDNNEQITDQQIVPEDGAMDDYDLEIDDEASQVATSAGRNVILMIVMISASIIFLYNVVFKEDEETKEKKAKQEIIDAQPVEQAEEIDYFDSTPQDEIGVVETPDLPDVEGLNSLPPTPVDEPPVSFPEPIVDFEPKEVIEPTTAPVVEKIPEPIIEEVIIKAAEEVEKEEPVEAIEPPVELQQQVVIVGPSAEELAARKSTRRKSSMLVINGGGSPSVEIDEEGNSTSTANDNPVLLKDISKTSAAQVIATKIGNTDYIIAQGKMISAVLETSINTDLPGSLRALISRDIYAESGRNILIPKGSRLIGTYEDSIALGQRRVVVTWQRIIRPDGIDINISSPGTDQLGRAGVTGIVDNKYAEIFGNSLLISAITIAASFSADKFSDSGGITSSSSSTTADGTTTNTQSGDTTDLSVLEAVSDFGDVAKDIVEKRLNDQPTILVNQGTRIKVFVNQDMIFPASIANSVKIIN